jgi:hypothetical protein
MKLYNMKNDIYNRLDEDKSLTDAEKREIYQEEKEQSQQEWVDENW